MPEWLNNSNYKLHMHKKSLARNSGYLISLALFSTAMVVLHHEIKHYHVRDIIAELRQVRLALLGLAVLLTILDYLVLTAYDALALRYIQYRLGYAKIALASFVGCAFSHNMTILGGSTARYRIYSALGVPATEVARLVVFCGLTFWLGFFALGGTIFLVEHQGLPVSLHIPFTSAWPIGAIFLAVVLAYLVLAAFRQQPLKVLGWELAIPSMPIFVGQIAIASLDWLLACGVLYVLLPAAVKLTYFKFLSIFMLAQALGLLSYVPGGLGVFEAVILLFFFWSSRDISDCWFSCAISARLLSVSLRAGYRSVGCSRVGYKETYSEAIWNHIWKMEFYNHA